MSYCGRPTIFVIESCVVAFLGGFMDIARKSFEDFPDAGSGETVLVACDTPGEPCDDGNSYTVNDTCIGKICFGQIMACQDSSSCPDNNCPFYYSSSSRQEIYVYDEENTEHKIMAAELIISIHAGSSRGDAKRLAGLVEGIIERRTIHNDHYRRFFSNTR